MPRKSDAKERLMNAAMDLIWENSYGSTSVDAICEKAGAKKGSFYHFFESKSELAVTALEADWQRKKARMDEIFRLGSTAGALAALFQKPRLRRADETIRRMRLGSRLPLLLPRVRDRNEGSRDR